MDRILMLVLITFIVTIVGGGGFYVLYLKSRPRRISWLAKCYQLGEGVKPPILDAKGNIVSDLKLNDLLPYIEDRLEKVEKKNGVTIYKLARLHKTTNAVNADMVELWGEGKKEVKVLIHGDTATLLKSGYDSTSGQIIFRPMPRERIDLIRSEIIIKKDRLKKEKNALQAITPWVVAGICMLGLVAIAYLLSNAYLDSSKSVSDSQQFAATKQVEATKIMREGMIALSNKDFTPSPKKEYPNLGKQPQKDPPKSIE